MSLKERYGHLIGETVQKENRVAELEPEEEVAMRKAKQIFARYKVSSMFWESLCGKLRAGLVEGLVAKGRLGMRKVGNRDLVWLRE